MSESSSPALVASGLHKAFPLRRSLSEVAHRRPAAAVVALDDVSVQVDRNEVLGVVGESGSGKSTLAHTLIRLVEPDAGEIRLGDVDLLQVGRAELRALRRRIQLVFQDPYSSLNPRMTIADAIKEPAKVHGLAQGAELDDMVTELLQRVGLQSVGEDRFPRQLSGGQRQRVAIARALVLRPEVLIADEAVSALDVSVQAQILQLLIGLREELELGVIFITHQLSVVTQIADRVAVMYLGRIVETGTVEDVFGQPRHPYTIGLLEANPSIAGQKVKQPALRGEVPSAANLPSGCRFRTRCPLAQEVCKTVDPPAVEVRPGHLSRCHVLAPAPESGSPLSPPAPHDLMT